MGSITGRDDHRRTQYADRRPSLYGMRHDGAQAFERDAVPATRLPINFKAWMNTKVLQVDDMMFSAKHHAMRCREPQGADQGR